MATTVPIPEVKQFLTHPDAAAFRSRDAQPVEDPVLAEAEEEEIAQLWAADPGNQGA